MLNSFEELCIMQVAAVNSLKICSWKILPIQMKITLLFNELYFFLSFLYSFCFIFETIYKKYVEKFKIISCFF